MANDRTHDITISASLTGANLSNFPYLFERNAFDDEVVDPSGSNAARTDGGDLRFYQSSNELEREIVNFEHDSSTGAGDAEIEIWAKVDDIDATTGATVAVEYGDGTLTDYATSATFGRDNVWSDYEFVAHLQEDGSGGSGSIIDATGNGNDGTPNGSLTGGADVASPWGVTGGGLEFDGAGDYINFGDFAGASILVSGRQRMVSGCVYFDTEASDDTWMGVNNEWIVHGYDQGGTANKIAARISYFGSNNLDGATDQIPVGEWAHVAYRCHAGTNHINYVNGTADYDDTDSNTSSDGGNPLIAGSYTTGPSLELDGRLDEIRIRKDNASADWVAAEYNNMFDPATYVTPGTPSATGGHTATSAMSLPSVSMAGTGVMQPSATAPMTLPQVTQAGSAQEIMSATAPQTLPAVTMSTSGSHTEPEAVSGDGGMTLPPVTQAGQGAEEFAATSAITLPNLEQAGNAVESVPATGALTLPSLSQAATVFQEFRGQSAMTLGAIAQAATGVLVLEGTGGMVLGQIEMAAQGLMSQPVSASAAMTLGALQSAGVALMFGEGGDYGSAIWIRRRKLYPP